MSRRLAIGAGACAAFALLLLGFVLFTGGGRGKGDGNGGNAIGGGLVGGNGLGAPRDGATNKTVLLIVPRNSVWGPDYGPLCERLRSQAGVKVVTASVVKGRCQLHAESPDQAVTVVADEAVDGGLYDRLKFDAVVFIGADTNVYVTGGLADAARGLIEKAQRDGRIVGGLCLGQVVLARHGTLDGREAAWGDMLSGNVAPDAARWNRQRGVVVDRSRGATVITGKSDAVVVEFADALLGLLKPS